MYIGDTVIAGEGDTVDIFTDWMPRRGDNAVFTCEVLAVTTATVTFTVYEKNGEETGAGTSAGTIVSGTSTLGLHSATISPLKEMVRYMISVTGDGATGAVMFRLHNVTWFNTARV